MNQKKKIIKLIFITNFYVGGEIHFKVRTSTDIFISIVTVTKKTEKKK